MCGIAGFITPKPQALDLKQLGQNMADAIMHRGPDSSGVWHDADIGLTFAHRRLAIQDLSQHGHQPMVSKSGRYIITYNGEIYNFKVLSKTLSELGHSFSGESDTEVMLNALEEWGIEKSISLFSGMFAFACWDRQDKRLYLSRDRLGEKPLYYGWVDDQFVFASELKAIVSHLNTYDLSVSPDALNSYMRFGYIPAPHTIYQGIFKLLPGCILSLSLDTTGAKSIHECINSMRSVQPKKYWDLHKIAHERTINDRNDHEHINTLKNHLNNIIKQQMIADVPTGTFLSGGIDSTLVTAIAQSLSTSKINTFTIGFGEKEFNEAVYAKKIAEHLGTNHHELYITPEDTVNVIPKLAHMYDEPFADSSQIPTYLVSKFAREHVTVCLSGDGGDEFFCGYNRYTHTDAAFKSLNKYPNFLKHLLSEILSRVPPGHWNLLYVAISKIFPRNNTQSNFGAKLHKLAALLKLNNLTDSYLYLVSFWNQPSHLVTSGTECYDLPQLLNSCKFDEFIERAMLCDQLSYLPGDNLTKVDRASMAVSLETRLPLLDHKLIEYSWSVPLSMKLRDHKTKWLLRNLLYQYVPQEMIERPKMGFSVPIAAWLRGQLKSWAEALLFEPKVKENFLNPQAIKTVWEQHQSNRFDHSHKLWTVLMYQAWLENNKARG